MLHDRRVEDARVMHIGRVDFRNDRRLFDIGANGSIVGQPNRLSGGQIMSLGTILLIILILLLVGALPTWPYSSGWGYYPVGGIGIVLAIIIILLLMGRI